MSIKELLEEINQTEADINWYGEVEQLRLLSLIEAVVRKLPKDDEEA